MERNRKLWKIVLYVYLVFLFLVVVIKFNGSLQSIVSRWGIITESKKAGELNLNLIPFKTIRPYLKHFTKKFAYTNIIGNFLLFIPAGFLFPMVLKRRCIFLKTMTICLMTVLGIEVFQLITCLGFCDIDDIILNMIGCFTGFLCFYAVMKLGWVDA